MKGFKCFSKGGALKGVPGAKRKGHPIAKAVTPGKKPVVATPDMPGRTAAVKQVASLGAPSPLAQLLLGANAHGAGMKAVPQGANPVMPKPRPTIGLKKGGKC